MAKISANGCTEVARYLATSGNGAKATFVLRSDRKVLKKYRGEYGGGYSIITTVKPASMGNGKAVLIRIAELLGYTKEG